MRSLILLLVFAASSSSQDKLDRDNPLQFLEAGKLRTVETVADWSKRRSAILDAMQTIMGPVPGKEQNCPLDVKTDDEVDCGSYVRRLISYQSEPGARTPAYLLIPKELLKEGNSKTVPGILSLHPTNARGFRVTVGLADYPNAEYGVELVQRGFVVIAPPYPLLSDYNPDLKKLGYVSGTVKAIQDNRRALDVLDSLPYVAKGKYAAIGHSLGGHNAVYTAVFDERIQAVVTCCGLDSYRDYMNGKIKGWTSERYMPKLLDFQDKLDQIPFDFGEILAAVAPRRVLVIAPKGDTNFQWASAAKMVRQAAGVYKLHGVEGKIVIGHPDCPHEFQPAMREKAYEFIGGAFK